MDYYLSPSKIVLSIKTFFFFLLVAEVILHLTDSNKERRDYPLVVFLSVSAAIIIFPIIRLLYVWLLKKPVLTANEIYIHDRITDRKYYWEDIEDVVAERWYLKINIYDSPKHWIKPPSRASNFISKVFSKEARKKTFFYIDIDTLDIDREAFLETLNNFSIAAESKS